MTRSTIAAPSRCAAEIDSILKALDDPTFTAEAFVRSILGQVAIMTFPPERTVAMRSALVVFDKQSARMATLTPSH